MFIDQPCAFRIPFLRFNAPDASGSSTPPAPGDGETQTPNPDEFLPGDVDLDDTDFLAKRGFPRKTAKEAMTPEQQIASWRYEAKKQQHRADTVDRDNREWAKLGNRDELLAARAQAEQARRDALPEGDRAHEDAIAAARAEGDRAAVQRLLPTTIESFVVATTRGADETIEDATARVKGALKYVDTSKFVDDKGAIDTTELAAFASTLAPKVDTPQAKPGDPLFQLMQRQTAPDQGGTSSIAEIRKRTYDARAPKQ